MEYGLHTSNAWMIVGHNNSIAESRGRFVVCMVEYCAVDSIYSERQGVHSCSSEERYEEIHVILTTEGVPRGDLFI